MWSKAGVVEAKLARLGLPLGACSRPDGRRVLQEVYGRVHRAGPGFD